MPQISIIIGAHNNKKTVSTAITSIISQTFWNWELIICDDRSTDGTYTILSDYAVQYPDKIFLLHHERNLGLGASLNDCLKVARGEYIARQDADDVSLPNRLQEQLDYLQSHPSVDLVGTAMELFDDNGPYGLYRQEAFPTKETLKYKVPFCHATIMARRRVFEQLGGYDGSPRARRCEDHELWFRFFEAGFCGVNLPDVLYRCRHDLQAARRRNLRDRWNGYLINIQGFRRLHFPWWCYCKDTLKLLKIFIPSWLIFLYHKQHFRTNTK